MYINYNYLTTEIKDFECAIKKLVNNILEEKNRNIIRLVFFTRIISNDDYDIRKKVLDCIIQSKFINRVPTYSLVAQKVGMDKSVAVEVQTVSCENSGVLMYKTYNGLNYVSYENNNDRFIFLSGIYENMSGLSVKELSERAFEKLSDMLKNENFSIVNIVRQWNYIENITNCTFCGKQNYQEFNNVRSVFYSSNFDNTGYPAATGIGIMAGGIMIDIDAFNNSETNSFKIDNKKQQPAYNYTKDVLVGSSMKLTTPKFERARLVKNDNDVLLYISGTAAIYGEHTVGISFKEQLDVTLNNIAGLLDSASAYSSVVLSDFKYARIYLKSLKNQKELIDYLTDKLENIKFVVLETDICRTNLLLEIEGGTSSVLR